MLPSVTFTPTPDMVLDAARAADPRHWGRHERLRWALAGAVLGLLVLVIVAQYAWRLREVYILYWQELALVAVAGGAAGWIFGRSRGTVAPDDPRLRERTVTIAEDGLEVTSRFLGIAVDWAAIAAITVTKDAVLFVTAWKEIHFVPRSAFVSAVEADAFLDAARETWSRRRADGAAEEKNDEA